MCVVPSRKSEHSTRRQLLISICFGPFISQLPPNRAGEVTIRKRVCLPRSHVRSQSVQLDQSLISQSTENGRMATMGRQHISPLQDNCQEWSRKNLAY